MEPIYYPVPIRVRYAETDQMGVAHHGAYPVWFEAARSELARALDMPYPEWERQGVLLMVSDLACRYRKPARYDQEITVLVRVAETMSRRVVFDYRVEDENGQLLAEGQTRHLLVERATGRPITIPDELREMLVTPPNAEQLSRRFGLAHSRSRPARERSSEGNAPTQRINGRQNVTGN